VSARGGSFYDKVFPDASIHLGWSAFAAHWLSEVPDAPLNHFSAARATNPEKRIWVEHARKDWHNFVRHRAGELVSGGQFVQVGIARDENGITGSEGSFDLMEQTLKPMLSKEQYDALRLPGYNRSKEEWLEPFLAEPDVWNVRYATLVVEENPLWTDYQKDHDLEKFVDAAAGFVRAAFLPGLFRDTPYDAEAIFNKLKATLRANPSLGNMNWRLVILHVERR